MSVPVPGPRSKADRGLDAAFAALLDHLAVLLAREYVSRCQTGATGEALGRPPSGKEDS